MIEKRRVPFHSSLRDLVVSFSLIELNKTSWLALRVGFHHVRLLAKALGRTGVATITRGVV